jgi:hypothetical protein
MNPHPAFGYPPIKGVKKLWLGRLIYGKACLALKFIH